MISLHKLRGKKEYLLCVHKSCSRNHTFETHIFREKCERKKHDVASGAQNISSFNPDKTMKKVRIKYKKIKENTFKKNVLQEIF